MPIPIRSEADWMMDPWMDAAVRGTTSQEMMSQEPTHDVHTLAAQGTSGAATTLPFLEQIQRSFGVHDVRGIRAHIGGPAAKASQDMGASAYATGNHVAFRESPDLHTAAHEAAHVVQQRAGVQLEGGVGHAGDAYERNADAVADAVVQGESAAHLLDGQGAAPDVQRGPAEKAACTECGGAPAGTGDCPACKATQALGAQPVNLPTSTAAPAVQHQSDPSVSSGPWEGSEASSSAAPSTIQHKLTPPGNCNQSQHDKMQRLVKAWCDHPSGRVCNPGESLHRLRQKIKRNQLCAQHRRAINNTCYEGGDKGHKIAERDARFAQARCMRLLREAERQPVRVPSVCPA